MDKFVFILLVSLLTIGCGGRKTNGSEFSEDSTILRRDSQPRAKYVPIKNRIDNFMDSIRLNMKFEISDTLKFSRTFYFSNRETRDQFLLTINPGPIVKSKSEFKIIGNHGEVIYKQVFDSYSFVSGIFQPPHVPSGGQEVYDRYTIEYIKSLTQNQYDSYVKKNIENFYERIHFVKRDRLDDLSKWDETNKDALKEVLADSTIVMVDISCFDCYEGGEIVFYSKNSKEIKTLLSHD